MSVVIPVYNGARYLAEAIESVLGQTHDNVELVVVDDGSDDGSAEVAERYAARVRCERQSHGGVGRASNLGAQVATGDFIAFLDADDRFPPDRIKRQLDAFRDRPDLEGVGGLVREFLSPDLAARPSSLREPRPPQLSLSPVTLLMRRASFLRVGLFSTTLAAIHIDWCARAADEGLRMSSIPHVVLERRLHADNWTLQSGPRMDYPQVLKTVLDRRRQRDSNQT